MKSLSLIAILGLAACDPSSLQGQQQQQSQAKAQPQKAASKQNSNEFCMPMKIMAHPEDYYGNKTGSDQEYELSCKQTTLDTAPGKIAIFCDQTESADAQRGIFKEVQAKYLDYGWYQTDSLGDKANRLGGSMRESMDDKGPITLTVILMDPALKYVGACAD